MVQDIFRAMRQMQREMDGAFARFFGEENSLPLLANPDNTPMRYQNPLADLVEEDDKLIATIDLPGVDKKDIDVEVDEQAITVRANRKQEKEINQEGVYRLERRYAGFKRRIPLPEGVNPAQSQASYEDGVLRIELPRDQKQLAKKRLEIK